jgi:predicted amidohydrolase
MIKVASTQYSIEQLEDWQSYIAKIEAIVQSAKKQDAQLLMFPEYAGIEIAFFRTHSDLELFNAMQLNLERYIHFYQSLAKKYAIYIQPGTVVVSANVQHQFYNRAYFFSPQGLSGYQDKLQSVAQEKEDRLLLRTGNEQTLFNTELGLIGIAVCYAKLILVPSYTPSVAAFHRVHYSCRARAIENQCYVMMSSAVNTVQFGATKEHLIGQAAVFCPIDNGFPEDGIIQQGKRNEAQTILSEISYAKIDSVRQAGQVRNFEDAKRYQVVSCREVKL